MKCSIFLSLATQIERSNTFVGYSFTDNLHVFILLLDLPSASVRGGPLKLLGPWITHNLFVLNHNKFGQQVQSDLVTILEAYLLAISY